MYTVRCTVYIIPCKMYTIQFFFLTSQGGTGYVLGVQLLGIVAVSVWTAVTSYLFLKVIDLTIGLRVSVADELLGADYVMHGLLSGVAGVAGVAGVEDVACVAGSNGLSDQEDYRFRDPQEDWCVRVCDAYTQTHHSFGTGCPHSRKHSPSHVIYEGGSNDLQLRPTSQSTIVSQPSAIQSPHQDSSTDDPPPLTTPPLRENRGYSYKATPPVTPTRKSAFSTRFARVKSTNFTSYLSPISSIFSPDPNNTQTTVIPPSSRVDHSMIGSGGTSKSTRRRYSVSATSALQRRTFTVSRTGSPVSVSFLRRVSDATVRMSVGEFECRYANVSSRHAGMSTRGVTNVSEPALRADVECQSVNSSGGHQCDKCHAADACRCHMPTECHSGKSSYPYVPETALSSSHVAGEDSTCQNTRSPYEFTTPTSNSTGSMCQGVASTCQSISPPYSLSCRDQTLPEEEMSDCENVFGRDTQDSVFHDIQVNNVDGNGGHEGHEGHERHGGDVRPGVLHRHRHNADTTWSSGQEPSDRVSSPTITGGTIALTRKDPPVADILCSNQQSPERHTPLEQSRSSISSNDVIIDGGDNIKTSGLSKHDTASRSKPAPSGGGISNGCFVGDNHRARDYVIFESTSPSTTIFPARTTTRSRGRNPPPSENVMLGK